MIGGAERNVIWPMVRLSEKETGLLIVSDPRYEKAKNASQILEHHVLSHCFHPVNPWESGVYNVEEQIHSL